MSFVSVFDFSRLQIISIALGTSFTPVKKARKAVFLHYLSLFLLCTLAIAEKQLQSEVFTLFVKSHLKRYETQIGRLLSDENRLQ